MAEGYTTDEEQVEALKKWWSENGTSVIVGAGLGIAAIFGWQFYQSSKIATTESASAIYESIAAEADSELTTEQKAQIGELRAQYPTTPYAVLASFAEAKQAVEAGELAVAEEKLRWVTESSKQKAMIHLAKWRLARVLAASEKYDEALEILSSGRIPVGYEANFAELRGDILLAKDQGNQAKLAYEEALALVEDNFQRKNAIQTKLESVQ